VDVGLPIEFDQDQRVEYRQVVADLLSDLAPSRWPKSAADEVTESDCSGLCALLSRELPGRHHGTEVSLFPLGVCPHTVKPSCGHARESLTSIHR
jgi:hypothetical protein